MRITHQNITTKYDVSNVKFNYKLFNNLEFYKVSDRQIIVIVKGLN